MDEGPWHWRGPSRNGVHGVVLKERLGSGRLGVDRSAWPMWVIGFALMIDSIDQYIVRGTSNQIEKAFGVGDVAIAVLFSAFILVNGLITMPASYIADRWNRTRVMAVTITAWSVVSALGGVVPTSAFALLVLLRGALGFGQAVTDPSGASLIADYYVYGKRGRAFSIQTCLNYVGVGVGLAIGSFFGTHFGHVGWRLAFGVSIIPGLVIATMCWRLPEPARGSADRAHVNGDDTVDLGAGDMETGDLEKGQSQRLFNDGFGVFFREMLAGLRTDVGVILSIPTMRFALVGVSSVLFTITAVATWMPTLYERQFHLSQGSANLAFGALIICAGIPGTIIGGYMADRWVNRILGARVMIPGVALASSSLLFMVSFIPQPFGSCFAIQLLAFLAGSSAVPALRAGLSDTTPAHLRGTGFGAFNMAAIIFGAAAAPLVTAALAHPFGDNYRVAFAFVMPVVLIGSLVLMAARSHIERDTARIFEAVMAAIAAANEPAANEPVPAAAPGQSAVPDEAGEPA